MSTLTDITVCLGSSCYSRGNREILEIIKNYLKEHQLSNEVFFHGVLCTGHCENGPIIKINDRIFTYVTPENIDDILSENL
jgi:NADH:ubiquinone oxidoreductase subunit E